MRHFIRKYRIIVIIIVFLPFLYFVDLIEKKNNFSPASHVSVVYLVTESVEFPSGKKEHITAKEKTEITFGNNELVYKAFQEDKPDMTGIFFRLSPVHPETYCPHELGAFTASVLRFIFFYPQSYLYEGKTWQASFCDNTVRCDYSVLDETEASATILTLCKGKQNDKTFSLSARSSFLLDQGFFNEITLDASITDKDGITRFTRTQTVQ